MPDMKLDSFPMFQHVSTRLREDLSQVTSFVWHETSFLFGMCAAAGPHFVAAQRVREGQGERDMTGPEFHHILYICM
jgi:hypothetical protein